MKKNKTKTTFVKLDLPVNEKMENTIPVESKEDSNLNFQQNISLPEIFY